MPLPRRPLGLIQGRLICDGASYERVRKVFVQKYMVGPTIRNFFPHRL